MSSAQYTPGEDLRERAAEMSCGGHGEHSLCAIKFSTGLAMSQAGRLRRACMPAPEGELSRHRFP